MIDSAIFDNRAGSYLIAPFKRSNYLKRIYIPTINKLLRIQIIITQITVEQIIVLKIRNRYQIFFYNSHPVSC